MAETPSQQIVSSLQQTYGTMQLGNKQAIRRQFYSYIQYPVAGTSQLNFFGSSIGNAGINTQLTNIPVQNSFGTSSFMLKAVRCTYFVPDGKLLSYDGTDALDFSAEFLNGIFHAGVFELKVNARTYFTFPKPFLFAPPADGRMQVYSGGQAAAATDQVPYADLTRRTSGGLYIVDPNIFIEAQQNFTATIAYPSGQLAPIITGLLDAGLTLFVGVILDGIEYRPVQ